MHVLCVGGSGYLGGALTDLLQQTEHQVFVYDNLTYEDDYLKPVPFVYGDVRERENLIGLLKWADCVVWLAAIVGDGACALNPILSQEVNQDAVKWLSENFDGRIVFISTCSVYGVAEGLLKEDAATNPLSVYAATKLAAEQYLKNKDAIIFRLGTLFGLGDSFSRIRLDLVVNTLVARAVYDGQLTVFGGQQYRPLLHVRDAALAIVDNLETKHRGIYNLHRKNLRIIDLARLIIQQIEVPIDTVSTAFEDTRNYRISSRKAQDMGFKPLLSVSDGITEMKMLLENERIKDINNPRYTNHGFLSL